MVFGWENSWKSWWGNDPPRCKRDISQTLPLQGYPINMKTSVTYMMNVTTKVIIFNSVSRLTWNYP